MAGFAVQLKRLQSRQADASQELDHIAATKTELGTEKRQIDEKAAQAKELLGTLEERAAQRRAAEQRAAQRAANARAATARASRSAPRTAPGAASSGGGASTPPAAVPASGRAAAAVRYAMAQIGDAYVWGASGPSAFDCSGLTMAAWGQAGVSLPHSSSAQMSSGTPVSRSQLQPGDLVFYYSPVSHVGMYIGNGQIVNAENPSVGVKITGVDSMPYAGAVRPG
jgi:cell wall-associated NlpC family hydrolase